MRLTGIAVATLAMLFTGCASTTYGYLYEPKDASVDASTLETAAASCRQAAKVETPPCTGPQWALSLIIGVQPHVAGCGGAALMAATDASYTNTEAMDACMARAGFMRTARP